jgi:L-fucose isomerase-like protein
LGWEALAAIARAVALLSLVLALVAGYVSMTMLFIRNLDLWSRRPVKLEVR